MRDSRSLKGEPPPAKAWWCPELYLLSVVAEKLKHHRLKPGGVPVLSKTKCGEYETHIVNISTYRLFVAN